MGFGNQNFKGMIDDVWIYQRALSADEIERIFRAVNLEDSGPGGRTGD
jgi:hypothetical protein